MKQVQRPNVESASGKVNTRGCLGFNDHGFPGSGVRVSSVETVCRNQPASSSRDEVEHGQTGTAISVRLLPCTTSGGRAIANHELRARVLFVLSERRIRLKTAAAARLVHPNRADDDKLFALYKALRVDRRIAAPHANSQQLGNFFRNSE